MKIEKDQLVLILPDLHLKHEKVEEIIEKIKPDFTILLGDYFDDFDDDLKMICETSEWFKWSTDQSNRIMIAGNHDISYWFKNNRSIRCSGYGDWKSLAINGIVTENDWEKLKFHYVLDDKWLLTHAGLHPYWINSKYSNKNYDIAKFSLKEIDGILERETPIAIKKFYSGQQHWFGVAGGARSDPRMNPYPGGLIWCDWKEEFESIRGISQICGHSPYATLENPPEWLIINPDDNISNLVNMKESLNSDFDPQPDENNSYNICIDSRPGLSYYGIYENQSMKIHRFID